MGTHGAGSDDQGRHYHIGVSVYDDDESPGRKLGVVSPVPDETLACFHVWECLGERPSPAPHVSVFVSIEADGSTSVSIEQGDNSTMVIVLPYNPPDAPKPRPVTRLRPVS